MAASGVDDIGEVVPLAVVVAGQVEGTAAAGVDVVIAVAEVPGAEVAVVEEKAPTVEGAGDILIDEAAHAAGGGGLDPDGHGERVDVEGGGGGDGDVLTHAIEGQSAAELASGPDRCGHQAAGVPVTGGIRGRGSTIVIELPVAHQSRVGCRRA